MTEKQKEEMWNTGLMVAYYFVPFLGVRVIMEKYFMEDSLVIGYLVASGLVGGIVVGIYVGVLRSKTLKLKLLGLGIVFLLLILSNLVIN